MTRAGAREGGYDRWRARRELVAVTARSAVGGTRAALRQRSQRDGGACGTSGVNLLQYAAGSGLSLGEVGSAVARGLAREGRPVGHHEVAVGRDSRVPPSGERRLHPVTVAVVQSGHVPTAAVQLPRLFSPARHRAAVVHYELPQVPRVQRLGIPFVDELWTTSSFVRDAFSAVTRKPVRVLPLPVAPPRGVPGALRRHLGLGDELLFAYQFDLASSGERKNPAAVARAYLRAFPRSGPDVRLLLKAVHAGLSPHVWQELEQLTAGRPDVLLVDAYWPQEVVDALWLDADCCVSLHRAEGFGLTLAAAMAAGTPVVATGYSGNLDLMTADTAVLVPHRTVPVGPDPVYPAHGTWAEPDLDVAVDALRWVAADREGARALGGRARDHVLETRTLQRTADWLSSVLP